MFDKRYVFLFVLGMIVCVLGTACADRDQGNAAAPVTAAPSQDQVAAAPFPVNFKLSQSVQSCNIETVNGESVEGRDVKVVQGTAVTVEGWVLPPDGSGAPSPVDWGLFLQLPDGPFLEVGGLRRVSRTDVSKAASSAHVATAGFVARFVPPVGTTGRVGLFLAPKSGDSRLHCAMGRGVEVVPR